MTDPTLPAGGFPPHADPGLFLPHTAGGFVARVVIIVIISAIIITIRLRMTRR